MTYALTDYKDGVIYTGAQTANTPTFTLLGGTYAWDTSAASTSQALQVLMPDGTTYQAVASLTTAAAHTVVQLAPGTYRIVFVATGDVQGSINYVPYGRH